MWFMFNHQAAAKTVYYLRVMWQEGFTFGFSQSLSQQKPKTISIVAPLTPYSLLHFV